MLEDMLVSHMPVEASTMFIDMDSFFASVEQQHNPELRNRPVGVCPCLGPGCIIVAASKEAKLLGIKLGTTVREARRICPDIALIADSPANYRQVHDQIMAILEDTPARVRPRSIDEAWLKLPFYLQTSKQAHELAVHIKNQVKSKIGSYVGASIGIAPNIWLAKMAATYDKPNGLYEIGLQDLKSFYSKLNLKDLNGISWRLASQCYKMGINSVIDLYNAPLSLLRAKWGVNGEKWYLRMRGFEVDEVVIKPQQTMSHQTTVMPAPANTVDEVMAILTKMSYKLGYRLRKNNQMAKGVALYLRFDDHSYFGRDYRSSQAFSSNAAILTNIRRMFAELPKLKSVRKVSIVLYGLCDELQLSLELPSEDEQKLALSQAVDKINDRYGNHSLVPASSLGREIFPDRIGFGNSR